MRENVNDVNSGEVELKLLNLDSMHVDDVTNEEVKELLRALLIGADASYCFNDFFCLSLLILQYSFQ